MHAPGAQKLYSQESLTLATDTTALREPELSNYTRNAPRLCMKLARNMGMVKSSIQEKIQEDVLVDLLEGVKSVSHLKMAGTDNK